MEAGWGAGGDKQPFWQPLSRKGRTCPSVESRALDAYVRAWCAVCGVRYHVLSCIYSQSVGARFFFLLFQMGCETRGECYSSSGPTIVPVARKSVREIAWNMWKLPAVALCGVFPVAAVVLFFLAGTHRHYAGTTAVIPGSIYTRVSER